MTTQLECDTCGTLGASKLTSDLAPNLWQAPTLCNDCLNILGKPNATDAVLICVVVERLKQIKKYGFDAGHDDKYTGGVLTRAATSYAMHAAIALSLAGPATPVPSAYQEAKAPMLWPWPASSWRPTTPREDLIRAAALIVAEIEKIDRAIAKSAPVLN